MLLPLCARYTPYPLDNLTLAHCVGPWRIVCGPEPEKPANQGSPPLLSHRSGSTDRTIVWVHKSEISHVAVPLQVRKISAATGLVTTVAGTTCGHTDGAATSAKLGNVQGLALAPNGDLYLAETNSHSIRRVALSAGGSGNVETVAGTSAVSGWSPDGTPASSAQMNGPTAIVVGGADGGSVYWYEQGACIVRVLDLGSSTVWTVAGQPQVCWGAVTTAGSALTASFAGGGPGGLAIWGNVVYIADTGNQVNPKNI